MHDVFHTVNYPAVAEKLCMTSTFQDQAASHLRLRMKQRFSSLDVRVIAHELSGRLVSLRLANIYDLSSRIFLLKFAKPDHREQLLIDSGFRCHLTEFARATAASPSQFVARLRKFLRTRRVTKVQQIGTDRVIEIQFSDGLYRLFLEFYAGGNVVLTDADLTILGLLRTVSEGAEHEQYKLGLKYDLSLRQNYAGVPELTKERVRDGLQRAIERQQEEAQKPGKKIKKKGGDALRKALAVTTTEFPPVLLDHALHVTGYDRNVQPEEVLASEELLEKLLESLQEAQRVVQEITSAEMAKGYILAKQGKASQQQQQDDVQETGPPNLLYDDFHPFKPAHLATDSTITFLEYNGFNKTADEFFSSLEGQKLESRLQEREDTARRKLDHARQEQAKRLDGLDSVQELNVRKAVAIEANVERVEEAVAAVNGLVAQGMDWVDIGRLIEKEQGRHNAVAQMIKLPLKLHENTVTLSLTEYDALEEEEEMADVTDNEASDSDDDVNTTGTSVRKNAKPETKQLAIDIDLALSPWVNARQYYDQKRTAAEKKERTAQASQKALKRTEQKVMADLKKGLKQEKEVLRPVRKQMWFEKFIYFISSDGYLVLAGRDAQQNEILYRRYLKKGDVYVHADLHGAASVIIKNNPATPEAPIPPSTLGQAGHLAVCTSSAWESKAVMSAWWVHGEQVSKTAPTGEYLSAGAFMVRGKKNFLPPAQLLLGFGLLWRISEESKGRHLKNRFREVGTEGNVATQGTRKAEESPEHEGGQGHEDDDEDDEFPDAIAKGAVDDDGEDDDDFPDASMKGGSVADHDDDDDDDLPDAQLTDEEGSVRDADQDHERRRNPLQMNGNVPASTSQEEHDEEEDDDGTDSEAGDEADDKHAETQESEQKSTPDAATPSSTAQREASASPTPNAPTPKTSTGAASQQPKPAPPARGKRSKPKKAAQKYVNQDDADRQLAMKLLGSQSATERHEADAASQTSKAESQEEARLRRREQHQKAQRAGLEAEEIRRLNLEEWVETLDEDEVLASAEYMSVLESLVAAPLPGDEILEVIPVCAPWSALAKYKYKAKLQPGQQKKGKAVREILGRWVKDGGDGKKVDVRSEDRERIWPREVELVRGMREVEVVGVIPVKSVRVMMGSGGGGGGDGAARGKKGGARGGKGSKRSR
ncbi:hypothetical protein LTR91_015135 [Friedmanniomyces endolithicus]|uniref:Ribosome quality control complex subunit 2 n=1 Tax=Friedmanniomyces endolithicus TaxID=329885 RepID=A0AAN6KAW8_9PEZI|nr:hypothetical protein LTR57_007080 [Friedmanniomyces endolithicus]KAK0972413.1 hypothetical protein LTR91_015135 [Friedmanniomyces endolithicus]